MKAFSFDFARVFANGGAIHYVLPHFQREYRWEEKHWKTLWEDAMLTYESLPSVTGKARQPEHFLGALVVVPDGIKQGMIPVHRLVDGQQRLTTISLLMCAFGDAVKVSHPLLSRQIQSLLINANAEGDFRFKILPTVKNNDRAIYAAIVEGKPIPNGDSQARPAYEFFQKKIAQELNAGKVTPQNFFEVLVSAFQVVWVELDKDENAYQIFESLNTKGEKLGETDLVRNYIAMRLPSGEQERIFFEVWAPIEAILNDQRNVGRFGELTAFLRHYDAMQFGSLPSARNIYARFRDEMKQLNDADFVAALHQLKHFATLYSTLLRPNTIGDDSLSKALTRLNALDISVAYPFLLAVADRHSRGELNSSQFCQACETLENYLVRRFLVDAPSNYLTHMFPNLAQNIDWNEFVPSLRRNLVDRLYPTDARVHQNLPTRILYGQPNSRERTVMIYERINRHLYAGSGSQEVLDGPATLEHILPQTLTAWWQNELGEEAETIARDWRHTLGNLTIVTQSYNSSLSNNPFPAKKSALTQHGVRLNHQYFSAPLETWDAAAIQQRAAWLIDKILEIWPSFAPASSPEIVPQTFSTPTRLTIRGEAFPVISWRQILRQTGEYLVRKTADFARLSEIFPTIISSQPFNHGNYKLPNDWFLNTNWSANDTIKQANKLLLECGIGKDEWRVDVQGGASTGAVSSARVGPMEEIDLTEEDEEALNRAYEKLREISNRQWQEEQERLRNSGASGNETESR